MDSALDTKYLQLALEEARKALEAGDLPVGAALVIDGKLVGTARNLIRTNSNWVSHAENELMWKFGKEIKQSRKLGLDVTIYTTFEPCLMCFGAAALNRISRIVYSCPDPYTGATNVRAQALNPGYAQMWPIVEQGSLKEESKALIIQALTSSSDPKWTQMLELLNKV